MNVNLVTRKFLAFKIILITLLISSCSINFYVPADSEASFSLHGGILATFKEDNQEFHVWVTSPDAIQQLLDLQQSKSHAPILYGRILAGPGIDNYNAPYNWHLDPEDVQIRNTPSKNCNIKVSDIEANVNYYINNVKYVCSQGAILVKVEDYRISEPHSLTADANSIIKTIQEN